MSTETNKAITRRLVDAINTDNEAAFLEVLVPDVVDHYSLPGLPPGREGWNMNRKILRTAFPDAHWHEEDLFAEGDRAMVRWTFQGTHTGELFGVAPSRMKITIAGMDMYRVVDGKIQEYWVNWDTMGFMQQLGLEPVAASASAGV